MKHLLLIICTFAAAIGFVVTPGWAPDTAFAQSARRGGSSVITQCYTKKGKSVPCTHLDENGNVKPEFKKNKPQG